MKQFIFILFACLALPVHAQLDFSKSNHKNHTLLTKMDSTVKAGTYERIRSIVIAQGGKVLFENYYNGADQNTKHNTRSTTKTIATLLTGIAIQKGHIKSEKETIFKYLKQHLPVKNPDKRKEAITIEDLLTMSSVMECNDNDYFSRGNESRMYLIEDWTQFYLDLPIRSYTFRNKPEDEPYGRSWSYCSAGSAAVSAVLESAMDMKVHEFAKKELLAPLGITDYKLHFSPMGILNTAGGSEYTSRDLLKLIQLCANGGVWNGQQIISANFLRKATSPQAKPWDDDDYGYLFWIRPFGKERQYGSYFMAGNGGQKVVAIPELDATVVITSTNYNNRKAHDYTHELLNSFVVPALDDLKK